MGKHLKCATVCATLFWKLLPIAFVLTGESDTYASQTVVDSRQVHLHQERYIHRDSADASMVLFRHVFDRWGHQRPHRSTQPVLSFGRVWARTSCRTAALCLSPGRSVCIALHSTNYADHCVLDPMREADSHRPCLHWSNARQSWCNVTHIYERQSDEEHCRMSTQRCSCVSRRLVSLLGQPSLSASRTGYHGGKDQRHSPVPS